jgi:hypothetical protein
MRQLSFQQHTYTMDISTRLVQKTLLCTARHTTTNIPSLLENLSTSPLFSILFFRFCKVSMYAAAQSLAAMAISSLDGYVACTW